MRTLKGFTLYGWEGCLRIKKTKRTRKLCEGCGKRVATYYVKGNRGNSRHRVRTGKHHTLCLRCYNAEVDRQHAVKLARQEAAQRHRELKAEAIRKKKMTKEQREEDKRRKQRQRRRWEKKQDEARNARRRAREGEKCPEPASNAK